MRRTRRKEIPGMHYREWDFRLAIYLADEYNKSHHGRLVKRLRRCVLSAESMGSNPIPVTR